MLQATFNVRNLFLALTLWLVSLNATATNVIIETPLGDIEIELFDNETPGTVTNFLKYVNDGDYEDSFIHRSVPGFVIQGGGFTFKDGAVGNVPTDAPIINEFNRSNLRGTIAMAKLGGDKDSATSQWFINTADNPGLDSGDGQGGGFFTVFGKVVNNGMSVVDAIAALQIIDAGSPFGELPVRDFSGGTVVKENLIFANIVTTSQPPPNNRDCDDNFVSQNPNELVIDVTPTGADDTNNIQCALNLAAKTDMPIVRLEKAEYTISNIIVSGFNGSFQGITRNDSIINIADQSISCSSMKTEGLTPAAIKFVRGEPRLRFMTIKASNPCILGEPLEHLIHFTGLNANDTNCSNDVIFGAVDRINIAGPGREKNILSAIGVTPEATVLGGCKNTLLGTFKLNRSDINNFTTGIITSMRAGAQVDINFCTFTDNSTAITLLDSNQSTTITSNEINSENSNPAFNIAQGIVVTTLSAVAPTKTRVVINNNQFVFSDSVGNSGSLIAAGIFNTIVQNVSISITNNKFSLAGDQLIAVNGIDINNATISANTFTGFGLYGIVADSVKSQPVADWTITANSGFSSFTSLNDILLGSESRQIIVGPNQGAATNDQGIGNSIL